MRVSRFLVPLVAAVASFSPDVRAQCVEWKPGFHWPGIDGVVRAVARFDDGSGNGVETYVGGDVRYADGAPAGNIAKWNGVRWQPVGGGRSAQITALCVFDDGSGPALYAAVNQPAHVPGSPTIEQVSRWDGTSWSELPGGVYLRGIQAMHVHDDGSGPALYVAGGFPAPTAPDVWLGHVVRFDGTSWSAVGSSAPGGPSGANVRALATFDDGTGPALYAGGWFQTAGGLPARSFARWDGSTWAEVGGGVTTGPGSSVTSLAVWRQGGVAKLAVGGSFVETGGGPMPWLASWDGAAWSTTGSGPSARVESLTVVPNGGDDQLVAAGYFASIDGVPAQRVARYDGSTWSQIATGVTGFADEVHGFADGAGAGLYVGCQFEYVGAPAARAIAEWRPASATWSTMGSGDGAASAVWCLRGFDDGSGPALYAGGTFAALGTTSAARVGRWDGADWAQVGDGFASNVSGVTASVNAFEVFDDGSGAALYAAGRFHESGATTVNSIARWDGSAWQPLAQDVFGSLGANDSVNAMRVFDDGSGPALYVGGALSPSVVRWNGTSWSAAGGGMQSVNDFEVFDDGSGPKLIAAGITSGPGGTTRGVARWNGTQWTPLGAGAAGGHFLEVCAYDDGSGNGVELYAGGTFTSIGALQVVGFAKWNGSAWVAAGTGTSGVAAGGVYELAAFDDGTGGGARLYASGAFSHMNGVQAFSNARWDGVSWSAVDHGTDGSVFALTTLDLGDGTGPNLYAGGQFQVAGVHTSRNVARFGRTNASGCPSSTGVAFCSGDGSGTACPCANAGLAGRGCENSRTTGGALLVAEGQAHVGADTVRLVASALPPSAMTLFLQGTQRLNGGSGVVFGDGLRCVGGSVIRLRLRQASAGVAQLGQGLAGDPEIGALGHVAPNVTRHYQAWYRDPSPTFCTSSTFNLSNAVSIRWVP